jgi:hypothetical protein
MSGWIKIHREIADHWIFQDAGKFKWWIDMLFLASYEANRVNIGNRIVEVKRGQFLGSLAFLSKRWGVSKERVISFLRLLQSDGMIDKSSDKNITLITICNYESYQDVPDNLPDNLPYYPADNLSDNLPDTTKEGKEVKEIYNSSTAHTCEEEFIRRYMEEGDSGMWSNTAAILHKNIPACKELFERWIVEYQHNGETHRDYTDFKRHFISWSRIAINKESKQQQSNGNNRPDYSRRGRADVPADITLDF